MSLTWNSPIHELKSHHLSGSTIGTKKPMMVLFYAPWCGHCKSLHPVYQKLSKSLPNKSFAVISDTESKNIKNIDVLDIKGYPSILIYYDGKFNQEYNGGRDFNSLYNFAVNYL